MEVPAPTSGSDAHSLEFWSEDWSNNVEMPHKTALFTVSPDTQAPVTTSDAAASYVGPVTIKLTADDEPSSKGAKTTYYRFDNGPTMTGTVAQLPQPASGTEAHAISFWSVDYSGNVESEKSATFEVTADLVGPTATTSLLPAPNIYGPSAFDANGHMQAYFYPSDPGPSSGIAGVRVTSTIRSLSFFDTDYSREDGPGGVGRRPWRVADRGTRLGTGASRSPIRRGTSRATSGRRRRRRSCAIGSSTTRGCTSTTMLRAPPPPRSRSTRRPTSDSPAGVADMRFSNDGVTWSDWEPYATTKAWTLDPALGVKRVYAQYRDKVGNVSYSGTSAASDTILLTARRHAARRAPSRSTAARTRRPDRL